MTMSSSDDCNSYSSSLTSLTPRSSLQRRRSSSHGSEQRETESGTKHVSSNGCPLRGRPSTTEGIERANRHPHVHVHSDISVVTAHAAASYNESLAEEELVERLKEIINEFMTRPDRQHSYDAKMRWTIDHGNDLSYSVIILISQASDLLWTTQAISAKILYSPRK